MNVVLMNFLMKSDNSSNFDETVPNQRMATITGKRRESDDKNAVAFVKSVSQLVCASQDSDALVSQGRKSRWNAMQKVMEPIQRVRLTKPSELRQASIREKKGPSLGKMNVKVPHQRSPYAMKFEDRSHEETETTAAMCPKQGLESWQKHIQSRRKRQGCILLSRGGMDTPDCVNKTAGGNRVLHMIQEGVCIWWVKKTSTLLSWRPWGRRRVRRRWWRPTARFKQEKKRRYTSKNWT